MSSVPDLSMNVPGPSLLHLEHFNFDVPSPALAQLFYSTLLSCTLDDGRTPNSSTTLWMNLGHCQFHLPQRPTANRLDGSVGIVIDPAHWSELPQRFDQLRSLNVVKGTQVAMEKALLPVEDVKAALLDEVWGVAGGDEGVEYYRVTGPWGNVFDVFPGRADGEEGLDRDSRGIAYGRIEVPAASSLDGIAEYYAKYFDTPTTVLRTTAASNSATAVVTVSPRQRLLFVHNAALPATAPYPSWHYCAYVSDYHGVFHRLLQDGLVVALEDRSDYVTDWDAAVKAKQFRALSMKGNDGAVVWGVEQEIRCGKHRHFRRALVNERQPMPLEAKVTLDKVV